MAIDTGENMTKNDKKNKYQMLTILAGILILAFVLASGILGFQVSRIKYQLKQTTNELNEYKQHSLCTSAECVVAAAELIESMDQTVDPCQDFYAFACGGWMKKHFLPNSKSQLGHFDLIYDQVTENLKEILLQNSTSKDSRPLNNSRNFFSACMDVGQIQNVGLKPLTNLLNESGNWPMITENWKESDYDWLHYHSTLTQLYGVDYLISVSNRPDMKDTDKYVISIDMPSLVLPRHVLVNETLKSTIVRSYIDLINSVAKLLRSATKFNVTDEAIEKDVNALVQFEIEMAKISVPQENRRDFNRMYNPMYVNDLQKWTDQVSLKSTHAKIHWNKYLNNIYNAVNITIDDNERVIVSEKEYLQQFVQLLDQTPLRVIANYIQWRLIFDFSPETTQEINYLGFNFTRIFKGTTASRPRWVGCVNRVNNYLGFAIGSTYVREFFDDTAKAEMDSMISRLKEAFKNMVVNANWMDRFTKMIAIEKADAMEHFIGYPEWIKNSSLVDAYYEELEINSDSHFDNIITVSKYFVSKHWRQLRKETNRKEWQFPPIIVNAFYLPGFNSIVFPAAILQPPFFGQGRISAMNYGSVGVIIGHEITHGFDDEGRQSDKKGNLASWWTNNTLEEYLKRAQCFINQYSNYSIPNLNGTGQINLNGINTQGENIADNGGLRQAYQAYMNYVKERGPEPRLPGLERYTPEQIFFISYAHVWCGKETKEDLANQVYLDQHSPNRFRVIAPLANSEDFVQQFKCPPGPMNKVEKCILW